MNKENTVTETPTPKYRRDRRSGAHTVTCGSVVIRIGGGKYAGPTVTVDGVHMGSAARHLNERTGTTIPTKREWAEARAYELATDSIALHDLKRSRLEELKARARAAERDYLAAREILAEFREAL